MTDDYELPPKVAAWITQNAPDRITPQHLVSSLMDIIGHQGEVIEILEVLEETCPECWGQGRQCQCTNDD